MKMSKTARFVVDIASIIIGIIFVMGYINQVDYIGIGVTAIDLFLGIGCVVFGAAGVYNYAIRNDSTTDDVNENDGEDDK
jgi:hypothetical protein